MLALLCVSFALVLWLGVLLQPWLPWLNREVFSLSAAQQNFHACDLSDITVLIPARNEALHIQQTLNAIAQQGQGLHVIVIDDQSQDDTYVKAKSSTVKHLTILKGQALPAAWSGKLWALQQGLAQVNSRYTLLLDADIRLIPGTIAALRDKMQAEHLQLISLMAALRMQSVWERLLMPAFIYYFKLIYPFALANNPHYTKVAAAAGGCIMVETAALHKVDAFNSVHDALIDDCTLAAKIKTAGYKTWLGLTHLAISQRQYNNLSSIWDMVARTAYTQLRYSPWLLLITTVLMLCMYWVPLLSILVAGSGLVTGMACLILLMMFISYWPTVHYYNVHPLWVFALPLTASLFLLMTWSSAIRYWRGQRSAWKGRQYSRTR